MHRITLVVLAFVAVGMLSVDAWQNEAHATDYNVMSTGSICMQLGADAGSTALITIPGGEQIMVRPELYAVRYRTCASTSCTAVSTDATLDADKSTDICSQSQDTTLSVYKQYDGGNPQVCVYKVNPRTVCAK